MAGKFADRNKNFKIKEDSIETWYYELEKGYNEFHFNPFSAIESACVYSTLKKFYKISFDLTYPNYQSANIILKQIENIVADAVNSIGDSATLEQANRFFNIAYTYLDTSINDIHLKK